MENKTRKLFTFQHTNLETLQTSIQSLTLNELLEIDEYSFDSFHYSIIVKDATLVSTLLQKLGESKVEKKVSIPYLHLAAIVGCPKIAVLFCKFD